MKMKPGCGCLILVLAICNLVFVIADISYLVRGPSENPVNPSALMLAGTMLIFVANVAVCVMLGLATLRGVSFGRGAAPQEADESTLEEPTFAGQEGSDEDEDQQ
jgi:hypothetical protein